MKRIIDGKTYNTETAEEIANWCNDFSSNDFRSCVESLFLTKKGAFFICGSGGAMSSWSRSNGNGSYGGDGIKVLSNQEALNWCESRDIDADVIETYFKIEEG